MRAVSGILTVLVLVPLLGCSPQERAADLLRRYSELHRTGDVEGLLALHDPEAEFLIPDQSPIRGTEALRNLFQWDSVLGSSLAFGAVSVRGDTVVVDSLVERNKWFEALGVPEVRYRPGTRFLLRGGKIAGTYPAPFDENTAREIIARFGPLTSWLSTHRPELMEQLLPGGRFRYDGPTADLWLQVLEEWRSSRQPGGG